jgi:hypothetical protein
MGLPTLRLTCVTGALLAFAVADASAASTLTVTSNTDSGAGSLRQELAMAQSGDTIVIPASVGGITVSTELAITGKSITIKGAGSGKTSVTARGSSRVFDIRGAGTETISGLLISGGKPPPEGMFAVGGDIRIADASVTLANDVVTQGQADTSGLMGGGISEGGGIAGDSATTLTLQNTTVSDNQASSGTNGDGFGGGVYDTGSLAIRGGRVDGNTASGAALEGGGIAFEPGTGTGTASIENASVSQNILQADTAGDQNGGGIDLNGGGGATIANVTIANNKLEDDGTTISAGKAEGGGISFRTTGTIANATVTGNTASANDPMSSHPFALGGGIFLIDALTVLNSTIDANAAISAGTGAEHAGGDIWVGAALRVKNSIVAAGVVTNGGQDCAVDPTGSIVSGGHNIEGFDMCNFHAAGDKVFTDPKLGSLNFNGGPVETMALQTGSPAIDAATDNNGCPATDARGVLRPAGAACDAGAYEVATPRASTGGASAVSRSTALLNGTATNPDLAGGKVSFQFGRTAAYGSQTTAQSIQATTAGARFNAAIGGLAPATTYHFREVIKNALGTSVGADAAFTTTSTPPQPSLSATGSGKGLSFVLRCTSSIACHVKLVARSTERLRGKKIIAITSAVRRVRKRTVVVGSATFTIAAGKTRKVTLRLNRLGRRLEAKFKKLPLALTITLSQPGGRTKTIKVFKRTLRPPKRHRPAKKH